MNRLILVAILVLAPSTFAESKAEAGPSASPSASAEASAIVQRELVSRLAVKEKNQSRFTRARQPATARRVRMTDDGPQIDARGDRFFRFAVDARYDGRPAHDEAGWQLAEITGCVYLDRSGLFVQVGPEVRPAAFLLGKNAKPASDGTCQSAAQTAQKSTAQK